VTVAYPDTVGHGDRILLSDREGNERMAEITSGDVTVMVLNRNEIDALGKILGHVTRYDSGPWGDAVDHLHGVLDALDIPSSVLLDDDPLDDDPLDDDPLSDLVTIDWLCERARVGKAGLRNIRRNGRGPTSYKMGRRLYFRRTEAEDWLRNVRLVRVGGA
jgi:hypothetical protein